MATDFPRDVMPREATWPTQPAPVQSWSNGGVLQSRTGAGMGRQWTEVYPPLKASSTATRAWLAKVLNYYRAGTALNVYHPSMQGKYGSLGGTPLVAGASQTGTSLTTDGWTGGATILAGDLFRVTGSNYVQEVVANATAAATGTATLSVAPGFLTALADNATLVVNSTNLNVTFLAVISEEPILPQCGPDGYYYGFTLTFRETG